MLRGHIDPAFRHQINHLVVGDLGHFEILLLSYDDGDLVAYYTQKIAKHVERRSTIWNNSPPPAGKLPKPFFHESVAMSAWGLAIHKQSRLIAVSTNLHEVTVFAFALASEDDNQGLNGPLSNTRARASTTTSRSSDGSPETWAGISALELEAQLRARNRDWRILLTIGDAGHNIPSISFADDKEGKAEKVIAVDINGFCWILDIWKLGSRPVIVYPPVDHPA